MCIGRRASSQTVLLFLSPDYSSFGHLSLQLRLVLIAYLSHGIRLPRLLEQHPLSRVHNCCEASLQILASRAVLNPVGIRVSVPGSAPVDFSELSLEYLVELQSTKCIPNREQHDITKTFPTPVPQVPKIISVILQVIIAK